MTNDTQMMELADGESYIAPLEDINGQILTVYGAYSTLANLIPHLPGLDEGNHFKVSVAPNVLALVQLVASDTPRVRDCTKSTRVSSHPTMTRCCGDTWTSRSSCHS